MAFSKVTLNGDTLMDVTQKTVTAATMLSGTTALKNDGTDITGNIASKSSSDLTASGATVTAPAGYYASSASKSVATGTATTPATTITANPSMSVAVSAGKNLFNIDCLLEADGWVEDNGDYYGQIIRVLEEYPVGTGVPIYGGLKENTRYTVSLTVRIDSEEGTNNGLTVVAYYSDGTHANVCGALRNQTTWTRISGTTTSGKTVTEICIGYSNGGANVWHIKEAQIEEGSTLTDYTPYAMQAVVNASVSASKSVTPTVSAGYVSTGTAGTVSVGGSGSETVLLSDLVSGTKSITASGTTDVTNYASASVAVGSATTPATSITANPTISVDSSGLITAFVSGSKSVTPTVSAGYVSSGTAGTVSVSGSNTEQLTTQAATTYHPSTTDQTIASGKYLTGAQTIKAVVTTNLTAANIADGVTVKIGDSTDDDCVASITGTHSGGGGGLEYEEGTFTPTTDIARQTISYANSHDEPAAFVGIYDATNNNAVNGSNVFWQAVNVDSISGANIYASSSSSYVGYFYYGYKSSDTAITTAFVNLTSFGSWTTSSDFLAYCQSSSRYWRSGRTYKWIAVWAPTT